MGYLAAATAVALGLSAEEVERVQRAAELHRVGRVAIPDAILDKPGPDDDADWAFMRRHTLVGERIIAAALDLRPVAKLVRCSHETSTEAATMTDLRDSGSLSEHASSPCATRSTR